MGGAWAAPRVGEPGRFYRALFGAPDVDDTDASAGLVVFHDALYVPGSTPGDKPFAVDVLTVHQRSYYGQDKERGGVAGERWPNDYDSPNPVGFISVRPGTKLLLALGGDAQWAELALDSPDRGHQRVGRRRQDLGRLRAWAQLMRLTGLNEAHPVFEAHP